MFLPSRSWRYRFNSDIVFTFETATNRNLTISTIHNQTHDVMHTRQLLDSVRDVYSSQAGRVSVKLIGMNPSLVACTPLPYRAGGD